LLIMDFDGTIAETLPDVAWCMEKTFKSYGLTAPKYEDVRSTVGMTLEDSLQTLSKETIPTEKVSEWVKTYRAIYKEEGGQRTSLFPGMAMSMQSAYEHDIKILVVSNKGMAAIQAALTKLNIDKYVDRVLSGDNVTHKKPDPALYISEIKPLYPSLIDSEVLVVGDTRIDLVFANNAGLRSCWAGYGYGKRDECMALSPTYTIKEAGELAKIIVSFKDKAKSLPCQCG